MDIGKRTGATPKKNPTAEKKLYGVVVAHLSIACCCLFCTLASRENPHGGELRLVEMVAEGLMGGPSSHVN